MVTSLRAAALGLGFSVSILAVAVAQDHPAAGLSIPQSSLTDAEHARAIALAEPQSTVSTASALHPDSARNTGTNRVVVTDVQAVGVDKVNERLAVVTSYQYEGNITINRLVDLNSGRVVEEDRIQNGGARFTNVEQQYARELLMGDERVRRLIEAFLDIYADSQAAHRVLTEDVKFLQEADRERVLGAQRAVVAAFADAVAAARPELRHADLLKPLTMLLFGMMNWMFTWLRPDGRLSHTAMAPVVADLFFGGLHAVKLASPAASAPPLRARPKAKARAA